MAAILEKPLEIPADEEIMETKETKETKPSSSAITEPPNSPIAFDHKPSGVPATRKELWAYYAYYAGNNGIGSFQ